MKMASLGLMSMKIISQKYIYYTNSLGVKVDGFYIVALLKFFIAEGFLFFCF